MIPTCTEEIPPPKRSLCRGALGRRIRTPRHRKDRRRRFHSYVSQSFAYGGKPASIAVDGVLKRGVLQPQEKTSSIFLWLLPEPNRAPPCGQKDLGKIFIPFFVLDRLGLSHLRQDLVHIYVEGVSSICVPLFTRACWCVYGQFGRPLPAAAPDGWNAGAASSGAQTSRTDRCGIPKYGTSLLRLVAVSGDRGETWLFFA